MRPLMERVTEWLERIQARPSTAPSYPDGLTQREVEVLRLVATGKTDWEIARSCPSVCRQRARTCEIY
jgi:DNA-binding NarL/FixJ family response regulator